MVRYVHELIGSDNALVATLIGNDDAGHLFNSEDPEMWGALSDALREEADAKKKQAEKNELQLLATVHPPSAQ